MYKYDKLYEGKFLRRYKRFFTDILYNGEELTAHNPNTGSMKMMLEEGRPALFSQSDNPKRKLKYTLEALKIENSWSLTNTILMNKIVETAIKDGEVGLLAGADCVRREFPYLDGRIDFLVTKGEEKYLVEVKNVTLFDDTHCMFPDAVTERGRKHLEILMKSLEDGYIPVMFYLCQIDRKNFRCAHEIDPKYAETLELALENGVQKLTYKTVFDIENSSVTLRPL